MGPEIEIYFQDLTELQDAKSKEIIQFALKKNEELVQFINYQQKQIEKVFFLKLILFKPNLSCTEYFFRWLDFKSFTAIITRMVWTAK